MNKQPFLVHNIILLVLEPVTNSSSLTCYKCTPKTFLLLLVQQPRLKPTETVSHFF